MRLAALTFFLVVALSAREARADLRTARAHLSAGKFEVVLEDLADSAKFPATEVANVFADASNLALAKGDRSLAGILCERAISRVPKHAKALRSCATIALEDGRFLEAREWGDTLGTMLPKDGEVALLRARASKALESWEMVVAILEPFEGDKKLQSQVEPLLTEARTRAQPATGPSQEQSLEEAVRAAREMDRKTDLSDEARQTSQKKGWRPLGERVVLYAGRGSEQSNQARDWLKRNNVDFEEKNADHAVRSDREFLKHCDVPQTDLKGRPIRGADSPRAPKNCRVPLILVNGTPVKGFDENLLRQLLGL